MKFVVSSSLLSQRLQTLGRVIVPKNSIQILESILFKIEGGKLTLTAADNETMLTTILDLVEAEGEFTFAVNAKVIQDAMKEIPEQPVDFYVNTDTFAITIDYMNGQYNIVGQDASEYPLTSGLGEDVIQYTIDSQLLLGGVNRSLFALSVDMLRPQMTGVCFDAKENEIVIVATDAQKMACTKYPGIGSEQAGTFILPKKPAMLLRNFLVKEEGDTRIAFTMRNASFITESYTMTCRLIEGRFPNYAGVISVNNDIEITINRAALLSTLRRVLIFSNTASCAVKLQFDNNRLTISSHEIDFSKSAEESLLCDYQLAPMSIGFHGGYLQEIINNIESEDVTFKLAGPSRAGLILPSETSEKEEVIMLLMPMLVVD